MKMIRPVQVTDSVLVSSTVPESDAPAWASGTTYALNDLVIKSHRVYKSIQASNLNHDPANSPTWWIDTGPTNRWAMFDDVVGSSTSATASMTIVLSPGMVDSLALLEVGAETVSVTMTVGPDTVYSKTVQLSDNSMVIDWYSYFVEPIKEKSYCLFDGMPIYGSGTVSITFSRSSGTVSCGVLSIGSKAEIGTVLSNPGIGINDYSRKSTDDFGRTILVKRGYSKRISTRLLIDTNDVDRIARILADYRATPVVWVGSDQFDSMIVFGPYKDFSIDIAYPNVSYCSLQVEGMI